LNTTTACAKRAARRRPSLFAQARQILRLTDIDGGANVSMMMLNPMRKVSA
jgi:hypothetical protein